MIDAEVNHQRVHRCRFGKANRATYKTLDPGAQIDIFTFDCLRVLFAAFVLLRIDMALVGAPPIGGKPCNAKRLQESFELQKDRILALPKNIR